MSKCVIPGCNFVPGTVRHRFPVYEKHDFRICLTRISNPNLTNVDDLKIYRDHFVCDTYFTDDCRSPGTKKLNRGFLPPHGLPGFHGGASSSLCKSQNVESVQIPTGDTVLLCSESLYGETCRKDQQSQLTPASIFIEEVHPGTRDVVVCNGVTEPCTSWASWTPITLQQPMSPALQSKDDETPCSIRSKGNEALMQLPSAEPSECKDTLSHVKWF